jgi:hypothetical protein
LYFLHWLKTLSLVDIAKLLQELKIYPLLIPERFSLACQAHRSKRGHSHFKLIGESAVIPGSAGDPPASTRKCPLARSRHLNKYSENLLRLSIT